MVYESALGVFSPDGRLIQVEYAQQASEQGSLVVYTSDESSICVSLERRTQNKMLVEDTKLFLIDQDQNIWMSYSGLKPDSYLVIEKARALCRNYKYACGEDMTTDQLAAKLSEYKQKYTLESKQRPLGLRTVLFGFEEYPKLFVVEPDGNFSEFRSGAVGQKSQKVCEYLEKADEEGDLVRRSIAGMVQVVQTDVNKVSSYILDANGCMKVDDDVVAGIIRELRN